MDVDATAATSPSNNTMLLTSDQQLQQQQQQQPLSTADVTGITVGYALDTMRGHSWALLSHVSEHLAKPGVMALLAQRVLQISKGETAAGTKEELEEDEGQVAPLPASPTLIQSSLWLAMFGVNKRSLSDPLFKAAMADVSRIGGKERKGEEG